MFAEASTIVFDLDGTLVDSMSALTDLACQVLEEVYGTDGETARTGYNRTAGLPFTDQLEVLHPGDSRNAVAVERFEGAKSANYCSHPLFDDVAELFRGLRARKCRLAISTSTTQSLAEQYVRGAGLDVDLVCGWAPGFAKGSAHFTQVSNRTGAVKEKIVFVGDTLEDARIAQNSGIHFVARVGTVAASEFKKLNPSVVAVSSLLEMLQ